MQYLIQLNSKDGENLALFLVNNPDEFESAAMSLNEIVDADGVIEALEEQGWERIYIQSSVNLLS